MARRPIQNKKHALLLNPNLKLYAVTSSHKSSTPQVQCILKKLQLYFFSKHFNLFMIKHKKIIPNNFNYFIIYNLI